MYNNNMKLLSDESFLFLFIYLVVCLPLNFQRGLHD